MNKEELRELKVKRNGMGVVLEEMQTLLNEIEQKIHRYKVITGEKEAPRGLSKSDEEVARIIAWVSSRITSLNAKIEYHEGEDDDREG